MSAAAYLVVTLDITGVAPCVKDVSVYSSSAANLTTMSGEIRTDVFHMEAPTYDEAHKRLIEYVTASGYYAWARPWVAEGVAAFWERENLRNCLRVAAAMVGAQMHRTR